MGTGSRYLPAIPVLLAYLILFGVGLLVPGKWQLVSQIAFFCALGQAFNLFMGMTGYVNFGYVAFLGVGTYGMALPISGLADKGLGLGVIALGLILAAAMSILLSLVVGAVALRLRGAYFAIATIGVNEGFRYLIEGARIWQGSEGIIFSSHLRTLLGREAAMSLSTFWADVMVFGVAVLAAMLTLFYVRGKIGYALAAVRMDEDAAKVMGINVTKYKIIAFVTSAALAGLLGATAWAVKLTYVYPNDVFAIHYTVEAIIIVLLGGAGTLLGPIVGALVYGLCKYYLAVHLPGFQLIIFAPLIIAIIVLFPDGAVGMIRKRLAGTPLERFVV
ncbi:MAG TPA: branched-chain amino acid ABC transporter permease [Anaeromyxobacteraceae bacterium]|nr:branched-chain amino acid ABC transporter permease [Anaeromyxobacteraceae bacterium]